MDSVGYKIVSEFESEDGTRTSTVLIDSLSRMYKVYLNDKEYDNTTRMFKFFTTEEAAENAAESWVLKND